MKRKAIEVLNNHSEIIKCIMLLRDNYTRAEASKLLEKEGIIYPKGILNILGTIIKKGSEDELQDIIKKKYNINDLYRRIIGINHNSECCDFIFNECMDKIDMMVDYVVTKEESFLSEYINYLPGYINLIIRMYITGKIDRNHLEDFCEKINTRFRRCKSSDIPFCYSNLNFVLKGQSKQYFFIHANSLYINKEI